MKKFTILITNVILLAWTNSIIAEEVERDWVL